MNEKDLEFHPKRVLAGKYGDSSYAKLIVSGILHLPSSLCADN